MRWSVRNRLVLFCYDDTHGQMTDMLDGHSKNNNDRLFFTRSVINYETTLKSN